MNVAAMTAVAISHGFAAGCHAGAAGCISAINPQLAFRGLRAGANRMSKARPVTTPSTTASASGE